MTDRITDADLAAMELREKAATKGDWEHTNRGESIHGGDGELIASMHSPEYEDEEDRNAANFEFIAHSRTDIPRLIAEVRRLRAACSDVVDAYHGNGSIYEAAEKCVQLVSNP